MNMRLCIEAWDHGGKQVLGNMYGQTVFDATNYKATKKYKRLKWCHYGRIAEYRIVEFLGGNDWRLVETFKPE
jgi:hypothetical protein